VLVRLTKLIDSLSFHLIDRFNCCFSRLSNQQQGASCVVLYYHDAPRESWQAFARQMDIFLRWTRPARADAVPPMAGCVRCAAVRFADGLERKRLQHQGGAGSAAGRPASPTTGTNSGCQFSPPARAHSPSKGYTRDSASVSLTLFAKAISAETRHSSGRQMRNPVSAIRLQQRRGFGWGEC
jgi:hypothetical protein